VRFFLLILLSFCWLLTACYHGRKPSSIGTTAPDFSISDADRSVRLEQFRGQILVLNFWATWCLPCVDEMPSLVQMQHKMETKGVTVLAVSVDDDQSAYHKFLKDHNISVLTVREGGTRGERGVISPVSNQYGTFKVPETYIIDRDGIIRRKFIGPVDWNKLEVIEYLSRL
jgi:cytochrome c biogenesis protein CcmG, thiol:disulfide interchange protein DsbE